eukprot:m.62329 g.62329  ORF g.62329 m.62329 type:complete len:126 (-) comp9611_c0_seq2:3485-3862(-)
MAPRCVNCRNLPAVVRCDDCGDVLCEACDQRQHKSTEAGGHARLPIGIRAVIPEPINADPERNGLVHAVVLVQFMLPLAIAALAGVALGKLSLQAALLVVGVPASVVSMALVVGVPPEVFTSSAA